MSAEKSPQAARIIAVGNEKGGTGKSTIAMHVVVALMKMNKRVATFDLDSRQGTFTRYIEKRSAWAQHIGRELEIPDHHRFEEPPEFPTAEDDAAEAKALTDAIDGLRDRYDYIVIDTPGHDTNLGRLAVSLADTLITPLNDSFVDLDVLGSVDAETLNITGTSHYAQMVEEARRQREARDGTAPEWFVLRNRLSMLASRNKRSVGEKLQELSHVLDFRCVEGLAERVIFREFYPRGLTALDTLEEAVLGTRPTLSHATARMEIETLLRAMNLVNVPAAQLVERNAA
jgi:chromosome partitioning protein